MLLALWTVTEVIGQILFKRGIDAVDTGEAQFGIATLRRVLGSATIWWGVAIHVVEFVVWILILGQLPLSIAFPLESISFVTVLLATRVVLREAIPARRWIGVGLICAGIVVLGASA